MTTAFDQREQSVFGSQFNIVNPAAAPDELLGYAKRAVAEKLYGKAVEFLSDAIAKGETGAEAHYYMALALLAGRKPGAMGPEADKIVPRVEDHLRRAVGADPGCAHAYALWAAVRRGYYVGRPEPQPTSEALQQRASDVDPLHAAELAPFMAGPDDTMWRAVLTVAQRSVQQRRPIVHKYFIRTPDEPELGGPKAMMVAGALGLLVALLLAVSGADEPDSAGLLCLALPLAVGSVYVGGKGVARYFQRTSAYERTLEAAEPKPTDEEMDEWLHLDKFAVLDHALRNLDRSLESLICEPQLVLGPLFPTKQAVGDDGVRRFSRYKFVILLLGEHRISVYSCEWDFVRCVISDADAFDFRYSDITGLRVRQLHDAPQGGRLVMTGTDGEEIEVSFSKVFEMIIAGTDRVAVTIDVRTGENHTALQPTGAAAAERLIRRQLDAHR